MSLFHTVLVCLDPNIYNHIHAPFCCCWLFGLPLSVFLLCHGPLSPLRIDSSSIASSLPLRPHFLHILTCSFHYLLRLSLSSSFPASSFLLPSLLGFFPYVASCLVTFSSSTWLCRQENQTLSELRQGEANADRALKLAVLLVVGERERETVGRGAFWEIKHSQSSGLCCEASTPCWDKLLVINAW